MFRDIVLVLHLLSVIALMGQSFALGLLPSALAAALGPEERARVWASIMARARPSALFVLGVLFLTGLMNIVNLPTRPGLPLVVKILLAGGVAGHVFAQVSGAGQRLIDAAAGGPEAEAQLQRGERSLQRLAGSQAVLLVVILYISITL